MRGTWTHLHGEVSTRVAATEWMYSNDPPYLSVSDSDIENGVAVHGDAKFARRFADEAVAWAAAVEAHEAAER
jgi:hypothetical protein